MAIYQVLTHYRDRYRYTDLEATSYENIKKLLEDISFVKVKSIKKYVYIDRYNIAIKKKNTRKRALATIKFKDKSKKDIKIKLPNLKVTKNENDIKLMLNNLYNGIDTIDIHITTSN